MKNILFLSVFFLLCYSNQGKAQKWFEGELTVTSYTHAANGAKGKEEGSVKILTDGKSIRLNGMPAVGGFEMISGDGVDHVLFRSEEQDIIFVNKASNEHLRLRKTDIDGLMQMMNMARQAGGTTAKEPEVEVKKSTETRKIQGLNATKHVLTNKSDGSVSYVWLADGMQMNWSWIGSIVGGEVPGLGYLSVSKSVENSLPLLTEVVVNNKVVSSYEITALKSGKLPANSVTLSPNARLLSLQDMIMKQMMQGVQQSPRGQ